MNLQLTGLHHVTAITGDAPANRDFYTRILGMRLVKKTVNQDDTSAYHLFYADRDGAPGTDLTFFEWPHSPRNRDGASTIARTALRVHGHAALDWWAARLSAHGIAHSGIVEQGGWTAVFFADPEGQALALVDDKGAAGGQPWEHSPVPVEMGIRGLHAVTLQVRELAPTVLVLTEVLGFRQVHEYRTEQGHPVAVFVTADGGAGTEVHVEHGQHLPFGQAGRGGVHHVAFRVPDFAEHEGWLLRLREFRIPSSQVIDRFYFRSIYFREPGGILYELATDGPGFTADEAPDQLGTRLALPPFLEPQRASIEAGLRPLA
ncbi:MAG: ring-cleaving dioxygenase [Chloroflexaceae bacterium]|nr:ring-cleaving dioxygenase [Chloroflexaceae bacterium]